MESKFFPMKKTPYAIEKSGGPFYAPELLLDPAEDDWWPDLVKPLSSCLKIKANAVNEESLGGYEGKIDGNRAETVTIRCDEEKKNGIVVDASKEYTVQNTSIDMTGIGEDDFAGIGAGFMTTNESTVLLKDSSIEMSGAGRSCTFTTKSSELTVQNCHLYSHGGPKPEDYKVVIGPGMLEPPPALGIGGTARTHLSCENSKTHFIDSFVEADGWACLSTDAALGNVYLVADNTKAKCYGIGYIMYSDGGCHLTANNCDYEAASHLCIIANSGEMTLNNVLGVSGGVGIMMHGIMGDVSEVGYLCINGGKYETQREFILSRSMNTYVEIKSADIVSKSGILVHAILNSDPDATKTEGKAVYGNNIVLTDMRAQGDIINDDPDRVCSVALERTTFRGATQRVNLSFDSSSRWVVTGDSSVVLMGDVRPEQIDAADYIKIEAYAGTGCGLSGEYTLRSGGVLNVR